MRDQLQSLEYSFKEIKKKLSLTDSEFSNLLDLSLEEYTLYKDDVANIPFHCIEGLSQKLNLITDKIIESNIDFEALQEHSRGNLDFIPQRYQKSKLSRVRTAKSAIETISVFAPEKAQFILKSLQISSESLKDLDSATSVELIDDIYKVASNLQFNDEFFQFIGKEAANSYKKSPFYNKNIAGQSTHKGLFEAVFSDGIKYIDKNWDYKILTSSGSGMKIKIKASEELQDSLSQKTFGSWAFTMHKFGFAKGLLSYIDENQLELSLLKSIHENSDHCLVELVYGKSKLFH